MKSLFGRNIYKNPYSKQSSRNGILLSKRVVVAVRWVREDLEDIQAYRPGKRISEVRQELGLKEIFKLSSNESPLPPFKSAQSAMAEAVGGLNRYPDSGSSLLKNKLSGLLDLPRETLAIGNGSNELIRLLAQVVLSPGDEVVMADPSFLVYPIVTAIMSASAVKVPLNNMKHDLKAMAAQITDKTKLIFVCNPNNPTGTIVHAGEINDFLKLVPEDVLVCFDEAYHEYVNDSEYRTALDFRTDHQNIVVLRTFSKIYSLAGARIGYGVVPAEILEAIDKVREPFNINTPAQVGAAASLDDQNEVNARSQSNQEQRKRLEEALDRLGMRRSESQTNFVYFNPGIPPMRAFETLKAEGLIVRVLGDNEYIRATLGTDQENTKLIKVLESLA